MLIVPRFISIWPLRAFVQSVEIPLMFKEIMSLEFFDNVISIRFYYLFYSFSGADSDPHWHGVHSCEKGFSLAFLNQRGFAKVLALRSYSTVFFLSTTKTLLLNVLTCNALHKSSSVLAVECRQTIIHTLSRITFYLTLQALRWHKALRQQSYLLKSHYRLALHCDASKEYKYTCKSCT